VIGAAHGPAADPERVIAAARRWLGTPYHVQASLIGVGCDCLGLARGVWRELVGPEPFPIPPYSRDWGETGTVEVLAEGARAVMIEVSPTAAEPGALVLFRMRPRAIAKHVGILSGPDRFIHACERLGVIEERLTQAWRRRVAFGFWFPLRTTKERNAPESEHSQSWKGSGAHQVRSDTPDSMRTILPSRLMLTIMAPSRDPLA
jgi:NlpC/P60 family putative phage cell wall peptidase